MVEQGGGGASLRRTRGRERSLPPGPARLSTTRLSRPCLNPGDPPQAGAARPRRQRAASPHVADADQRLAQLVVVLVVKRDADEQLDLAVHALQAQRVAVHAKVAGILRGGGPPTEYRSVRARLAGGQHGQGKGPQASAPRQQPVWARSCPEPSPLSPPGCSGSA